MTIDEKINEYSILSCTYENQNMYIERPKWEQIRTWVRSHNKLSKSEVSAQLRNNFEHVMEQDKSNMNNKQINPSIN